MRLQLVIGVLLASAAVLQAATPDIVFIIGDDQGAGSRTSPRRKPGHRG